MVERKLNSVHTRDVPALFPRNCDEVVRTETLYMSRRDRIEKSLKAVMRNMIQDGVPMVNALCNREVLKGMIDELDENCTRKMTSRIMKEGNKNASKSSDQKNADVAEAYSPPRMAAMAAEL